MKNNIVHCSKIPGLISIDSNRVDIFLKHTSDNKIKSFSLTKLDLSGLQLSENAKIELICETEFEEIFYSLGTIINMKLKLDEDLLKYKLSKNPKFRIIVFVSGESKLLAATDNIKIKNDDENSSARSLLPVNCVDNLENRLWQLHLSDNGPELHVNNNPDVNMTSLLEQNILVKSIILPEVISQVLRYIIKKDDNSREWINNWQIFAAQYGIDLLNIDQDNDEEINNAIDKIVRDWCNNLSLCEQIAEKEIEEA